MARKVNWRKTVQNLEKAYGTQKELAESLDVATSTVRRWKNNNRVPKNSPSYDSVYHRARRRDLLEYKEVDRGKIWRYTIHGGKVTRDGPKEHRIELQAYKYTKRKKSKVESELKAAFRQARSIAGQEIYPFHDVEIAGIERERVSRDEAIDIDESHGVAIVEKSAGSHYEYKLNFRKNRLVPQQ